MCLSLLRFDSDLIDTILHKWLPFLILSLNPHRWARQVATPVIELGTHCPLAYLEAVQRNGLSLDGSDPCLASNKSRGATDLHTTAAYAVFDASQKLQEVVGLGMVKGIDTKVRHFVTKCCGRGSSQSTFSSHNSWNNTLKRNPTGLC